jgi:hypothetical protein
MSGSWVLWFVSMVSMGLVCVVICLQVLVNGLWLVYELVFCFMGVWIYFYGIAHMG